MSDEKKLDADLAADEEQIDGAPIMFKDSITRFKPLDDERQKDVLFIALDMMDYYQERVHEAIKAGDDDEADRCFREMAICHMFASALTEQPEWMAECGIADGFLWESARADREAWEKKGKA